MQHRITLMCLIPWTVCCAGFASTATAQRGRDPAALFKDWDRNDDGKLTRDEVPEGPRRNFDRVDRDKNGSITLEEHTAFLNGGDKRRRPRIPETVSLQRDIAYAASDNIRQTLHLLLPKKRKHDKPLPVVAFIHGGAWRSGNKDSGLGRIMPYVANGEFAAVSIGYRLTGEAQWPAQIHDCKAAI